MVAVQQRMDAPIDKVRVIGIFAHVDAGKTTTSEAILYHAGRIRRAGSVDDGNTQLDWMEQERTRGITITSAATALQWREHRINLIDTPGHVDFTAEVVRSIRVIDGAVVLLCGVGGVEPQTEAVWMRANQEKLPRVLFVNKLDRQGADFQRVLGEVRERLTTHAVPLQLPIGREGTFRGVVDLFTQQALIWHDQFGEPSVEAIPAEIKAEALVAREAMIDAICETDDELLERRLDGNDVSMETLQAALRQATIDDKLVPVLCGATRNGIGVQPLLDAVVGYLPAPVDLPPVIGTVPGSAEEMIERPNDASAPLCASAFKIVTDPYVGRLTWVRVFSGSLDVGDMIYNPRAGVQERVGRIYRMHGAQREQVDRLSASDVVALVGVRSAVTGDSLCNMDQPMLLEDWKFPEPVIAIALAAADEKQRDELREAVGRLCSEDPTLVGRFDPETEELTLAGLGELHLEIAVDRLRTEFGIEARTSAPQVAYRETARRLAEVLHTYKKQTGGHGHFAEVRLSVEPLERGAGVVFENGAAPADFPREFVRPVEMGVREALDKGVIAGYPVTDVKVTLLGGRAHEVDSAAVDFQIAGSMAVRQAFRQADPTLLEPIMAADVNVAEEYVGPIVADMGRRRGLVRSMRLRGQVRNIEGDVPLADTFGYATDIRSLTQGRGTFTLEFSHYDLVPESIAAKVVRERQESGALARR